VKRALALVALTLACGNLVGGDLSRIIAIDIIGSLEPAIEVGDTLQLEARAVDARGNVVPDAVIVWAIVDTGVVGFTIDSSTGLVTAESPDTGRVVAQTHDIRSGEVEITVTDTSSAPLGLDMLDRMTQPESHLALPDEPVHLLVVERPPRTASRRGSW
jgi:hypothetical protein